MKRIYTIFVLLFFCAIQILSQPQIDASYMEPELVSQIPSNVNFPEPKHVLLVYKVQNNPQDTVGMISTEIMEYYRDKREIPLDNIFPLTALDTQVVIDGHVIKLVQNGEIIKDTTQAWADRDPYYAGPSNHAWQYFNSNIFIPIQSYLRSKIVNGDTLKNTIRYIVLCKGVPIRIQARWNWSGAGFFYRWNVAVDPLLCYLNQSAPNFSILSIYGTNYYNHSNPYRQVDIDFSFNYRFKSNHFPIQNTNLKLSYLISRLDGLTKDKVIDLIDKSSEPDHSGEKTWVIDTRQFFSWNTPFYQIYNNYHYSVLKNADTKLVQLGFNTNCDDLDTSFITTNSGNVIGYTSWGAHSYLPTGYIIDNLNFQYENGAIFNTIESFNGNSMGINFSDRSIRRDGQGLISEFIYTGGIGGAAHTWEPYLSAAVKINYFYPAYAMGYSVVDAAYQGMDLLGWQNIVIGDPLTTIAWGKQTLTSNLNWSGTNLVTGEIDISDLKTLTIANNSVINLRHQGFITGEGKLILGQNVTINIYSWQKGLFLSYDGDSPRLVWGAHPTLGPAVYYKVYRKVGTGLWELLTTTTALQYTDTQILFSEFGEGDPNIFYKVLAYTQLPTTYESNTVSCFGYKNPKKIVVRQNQNLEIEYSLRQNYPNPFNPITKINYSIKNAGLVQIKIYDILGSEVATLVNEEKVAGKYEVNFNASSLASGVYIYKIQAGSFINSKKMLLLK